jgi:hypothetical protein
VQYFVQLSQLGDELPHLPPQEMQAVMGADDLNVKIKQVPLECALQWMHRHRENREGNIVELM